MKYYANAMMDDGTYLWVSGRPKTTKNMAAIIRIDWETSSRRAVAKNTDQVVVMADSASSLLSFGSSPYL